MPTVLAPGVAQTVFSGHIGAQPWASIMHWQIGSTTAPWTLANLQLLCDSCHNSYSTEWAAQIGNNVHMEQVAGVDLGTTTPVATVSAGAPIVGSAPGQLEPSSLCDTVLYKINSRYRGGHPRGYWPFCSQSNLVNESQFTPAHITFVQTQFAAMVTAIVGAFGTAGSTTLLHVVPRYTYTYTNDTIRKKYVKERTGYIGTFPVQGYTLRQTVGSQRRRLTL